MLLTTLIKIKFNIYLTKIVARLFVSRSVKKIKLACTKSCMKILTN